MITGLSFNESQCKNCSIVYDTRTWGFYVKGVTEGRRTYTVTVRYTLPPACPGPRVPVSTHSAVSLSLAMPFTVTAWCESLALAPVSAVCPGVPFLLCPRVAATAHVPLTLLASRLVL